MAIYMVKAGRRFGGDNQYGPGDKVELSPQEAAGFLDKLSGPLAEEVAEPDAGGGTNPPAGDLSWGDLAAKTVTALEAAGMTPATAKAASDDDLLAIEGIGPAALVAIRGAFAS